jgi:hypothetical protein
MQLMSCAYSDRISCRTAQKPICGGTGGGGSGDVPRNSRGFVESMATTRHTYHLYPGTAGLDVFGVAGRRPATATAPSGCNTAALFLVMSDVLADGSATV